MKRIIKNSVTSSKRTDAQREYEYRKNIYLKRKHEFETLGEDGNNDALSREEKMRIAKAEMDKVAPESVGSAAEYSDYKSDRRIGVTNQRYKGYMIRLDRAGYGYNVYDKNGELEDSGYPSKEAARNFIDELVSEADDEIESSVDIDEETEDPGIAEAFIRTNVNDCSNVTASLNYVTPEMKQLKRAVSKIYVDNDDQFHELVDSLLINEPINLVPETRALKRAIDSLVVDSEEERRTLVYEVAKDLGVINSSSNVDVYSADDIGDMYASTDITSSTNVPETQMIDDLEYFYEVYPEAMEPILIRNGATPDKDNWLDGCNIPQAYDEAVAYFESKYDNDDEYSELDTGVGSRLGWSNYIQSGIYEETEDPKWICLDIKHVRDSDGMLTDYALYTTEDEDKYICMFGDVDVYPPDEMYADAEFDTEEEALEWFEDYTGPGDEDEDEDYDIYHDVIDAAEELDEDEDDDDLDHPDQEFDSADTSINSTKLPAIYKMITIPEGSVGVDFGGGKWNNAIEHIRDLGATLCVYDPYNRSKAYNKETLKTLRANGGADWAVTSNVLNVIKEPSARKAVLENISKITKSGAPIYITVYEGRGDSKAGQTKSGYQLNRKTKDYMEEIQEVFPDATRRGKLIIAHNIRSASSSTVVTAASSGKLDKYMNVTKDRKKYAVHYTEVNTEQDAWTLYSDFRAQVSKIAPYDDADYAWADIRNGHIDVIRNGKVVKRSYYFNADDMEVENTEWCDIIIDEAIDLIAKINKDIEPRMVYNSTSIAARNKSNIKASSTEGYAYTYCDECGKKNRVKVTFNNFNEPFNDTEYKCKYCGTNNLLTDPHSYDENGDVVKASQSYLDRIEELMKQGLDEETASREAYAEFYPDEYDVDDYDEIYSANYGGAYDVDPEQYFTREDLVEFADDVISCIANSQDILFDVSELYIEGNNITLGLTNTNNGGGFEHTVTFTVDMRKIHKPWDLQTKYSQKIANMFIDEYNRCTADDEIYSSTTSSSRYWYFTRHGVQPGSVPKYVNILDIIDTPEGSYFLADGVILTKDLRDYDIKERKPEDSVTSSTSIESSDILEEIREQCNTKLTHIMAQYGFDESEAKQYSRVDASIDDQYGRIEIGCELDYDGLMRVCQALDPIVQAYDPDSYFEPVDSGIAEAWVNLEKASIDSSSNIQAGAYDFPEPSLDPPEYDDPEEVDEDVTVEFDMDRVRIDVDKSGSWKYVDDSFLNDVMTDDALYSEEYDVKVRDRNGLLEDLDDILKYDIPVEAGEYRISCHITLVYHITGIEKYDEYPDDNYGDSSEYSTENAEVKFDFHDSYVEDFRIVD